MKLRNCAATNSIHRKFVVRVQILVLQDDVVHAEQDRHLQQQRQAAGERIDLVGFVERHLFLLEALRIGLVPLL